MANEITITKLSNGNIEVTDTRVSRYPYSLPRTLGVYQRSNKVEVLTESNSVFASFTADEVLEVTSSTGGTVHDRAAVYVWASGM